MGIMSNFVTKFMAMGYEMPTIFQMLGIAGVLAIPGSIVVGSDRWQDRNKENWYPDQCPGADRSSLLSDTCNSITLYLTADPCSYAWWII